MTSERVAASQRAVRSPRFQHGGERFDHWQVSAINGAEHLQQAVGETRLLDDLVGAGEERWRNCEAKRPGGLQVDDELELRDLLHPLATRTASPFPTGGWSPPMTVASPSEELQAVGLVRPHRSGRQ